MSYHHKLIDRKGSDGRCSKLYQTFTTCPQYLGIKHEPLAQVPIWSTTPLQYLLSVFSNGM